MTMTEEEILAQPLLSTKLHPPALRAGLVARPHLIAQLNASGPATFTLISAPAGSGKTTLLTQWQAQSRSAVAWLTLDARDNAVSGFLRYLTAALRQVEPALAGIGDLPSAPDLVVPSPAAMTLLANAIGALPRSLALVLDDFHLISSTEVQEAVMFLATNLPPRLHLLVATRADPPWPLARLRAQGRLLEIRAAELRFTKEEATTLLGQFPELELTEDVVTLLTQRMEGWVTGLQLAALSLRHRRVAGDLSALLGGTDRFVLDYLIEEVLAQQPDEIGCFLLKTSILEQMCPALCDVVAETADSAAMLAHLEHENLFVRALDDQGRWYRYHQLFRELLRNRLRARHARQIDALHRRASDWYAVQGLTIEAVNHALAAGDLKRVAALLKGKALATMNHGELNTLLDWLVALPEARLRHEPWLCVAYAWTLIHAGRLGEVERLLALAEQSLPHKAPDDSRHIRAQIASLRTYQLTLAGQFARAANRAQLALEDLPEDDHLTRGWTATLLAAAFRHQGQLDAQVQTLSRVFALSAAADDKNVHANALCDLAELHCVRGELQAADRACREALELAAAYTRETGRQLPVRGHVLTRLSMVRREQNDLQTAVHLAQEGLQLCRQWGQVVTIFDAYLRLARTLQSAGEGNAALSAVAAARSVARHTSTWHQDRAAALEAILQLRSGQIALAGRWAVEQRLRVDDEFAFPREQTYRAFARVLLAQDRPEQALQLLERLLYQAQQAGATLYVIELLILQALAFRANAQTAAAATSFNEALTLAQPAGCLQTFLDEQQSVVPLLRQAVAAGHTTSYASRLLNLLHPGAAPRPAGALEAERLTGRELEILRMLTTHLSSTDIAQALTVSPNTVRTHIKHIYGKLDVHNRDDAVRKGRELGLL